MHARLVVRKLEQIRYRLSIVVPAPKLVARPAFDRYAGEYHRVLGESVTDTLTEGANFAECKVGLMASHLRDREVRRVLDFGCNAGRSLPYLEKSYPNAEILGFDVSPVSLKVAHDRSPRAQLFGDWDVLGETGFDAI